MSRIENSKPLTPSAIADPLAADGGAANPAPRPEGRDLYLKQGATPSTAPIRQSVRRHNAHARLHAHLSAEFQAESEDTRRILTRCAGLRQPG